MPHSSETPPAASTSTNCPRDTQDQNMASRLDGLAFLCPPPLCRLSICSSITLICVARNSELKVLNLLKLPMKTSCHEVVQLGILIAPKFKVKVIFWGQR